MSKTTCERARFRSASSSEYGFNPGARTALVRLLPDCLRRGLGLQLLTAQLPKTERSRCRQTPPARNGAAAANTAALDSGASNAPSQPSKPRTRRTSAACRASTEWI